MPELGTLRGYSLPQIRFNPVVPNFGNTPDQLPPDLTSAAKLQAHGAVMGQVAKTLQELPGLIVESYLKGKEDKSKQTALDLKQSILEGGTLSPERQGALSGFTFGPGGETSYRPEDPRLVEARLSAAKAAEARALKTPEERQRALFDDLSKSFNAPGAAAPAPGEIKLHTTGYHPYDASTTKEKRMEGGKVDANGDPIYTLEMFERGEAPYVTVAVPQGSELFGKELTSPDRPGVKFKAVDHFGTLGGELIQGDRADVAVDTKDAASKITGPMRFQVSGDPRTAQIEEAATDIGEQLPALDLESLTASSAPGAVTPANVEPALANLPIRRATVGRDPVSGAMLYSPSPTDMTAIFSSGDKLDISPKAADLKENTGLVFNSAKEAQDAGYDPTDAEVMPDGKIKVTKFKASGTDVRGRSKITDTQKSALGAVANLSKSIDGLMEKYDEMQKAGMAGPIAGRIEKGKQSFGLGSEKGSQVQAEMSTALFKIARMLNGAGVLTDKDIARAESVAPTITMGRNQFKGQLEAVKGTMRDSLETWLSTNAGQATDEQIALAKAAVANLEGRKTESSPETTGTPTQVNISADDASAIEWLKSDEAKNDVKTASQLRGVLKAKGLLK